MEYKKKQKKNHKKTTTTTTTCETINEINQLHLKQNLG